MTNLSLYISIIVGTCIGAVVGPILISIYLWGRRERQRWKFPSPYSYAQARVTHLYKKKGKVTERDMRKLEQNLRQVFYLQPKDASIIAWLGRAIIERTQQVEISNGNKQSTG